jgi:D,D-heptose 1,7-bisphosphate phosphatase
MCLKKTARVDMKTVIMAGGKGTRISSIASDIPKPMIKIDGIPVLEREIGCLRDQGFTDITLTVSHLGQIIMDYFGDGTGISPATGRSFGVHIDYYFEKEPLGNAGALFRIKDRLGDGDFLLLNADSMFDVDFKRFVTYHKEHGGLATLFTHPNSHPYDSGLIIAGEDHSVQAWLTKEDARPQYYKNRVNAGLHVINVKLLDQVITTPKIDLDRQLLKPLAGTGTMFCYDSPEYVKDMGTPERYYAVNEDCKTGRIQAKNLQNKQKAIFLDRDGTINKYVGFLRNIDDFELLDGAAEAIRKINNSGYLAVVVTNQPVIARGEVTFEELDEIHKKMETLLGDEGAYLDGIYFCPHHPDKGFDGELPELKISCGCRKPKPGMLLQAAKDYNIDLSSSWMVGDGKNDIECGKNAGCKTCLIGREKFGQDCSAESLLDFVNQIVK